MSINCDICREEKDQLFTRCGQCNLRICMDCLMDLYQKRSNPTQLFPSAGVCIACYQYFDEAILLYIRNNPDDAPLFVNISLQYTPWDDVLKDILRGELRGKRLFDTINRCVSTKTPRL